MPPFFSQSGVVPQDEPALNRRRPPAADASAPREPKKNAYGSEPSLYTTAVTAKTAKEMNRSWPLIVENKPRFGKKKILGRASVRDAAAVWSLLEGDDGCRAAPSSTRGCGLVDSAFAPRAIAPRAPGRLRDPRARDRAGDALTPAATSALPVADARGAAGLAPEGIRETRGGGDWD